MKIAIIDNYDSFTYNLSHLVKELGANVTVLRNDQFRLDELDAYSKIILSPGPGIPSEAGRQVCCSTSSAPMPAASLSWACVWAIKLSARLSVPVWKT